MSNVNQTVVIRTDIFDLPKDMGLLSAQVAHIHFEIMREYMRMHSPLDLSEDMKSWLDDPYLLVKKVPNKEALDYLNVETSKTTVPVRLWKDTIYVNLSPNISKAFPDVTVGMSLGPADADDIRLIVGDLPLL